MWRPISICAHLGGMGPAADLARYGFTRYPQRDSNPPCRRESAKPCIFRQLPRSLIIG